MSVNKYFSNIKSNFLYYYFFRFKNVIFCIFLFLILLPLPLCWNTNESYCATVILYMGLLWITEAVPLAITSLIPVVAFPLFGIDEASNISSVYMNDSNFVFFGSMVMAACIEANKLHERVALRILLTTGSNPRYLMLGFQFATILISLWISNTGTAAMMTPIALAVINQLEKCRTTVNKQDYLNIDNSDELLPKNIPIQHLKIYRGILLAIAFSSSIGGTGTLIGTGANVVLSGYLSDEYGNKTPVTFASWMLFVIPQCILLSLAGWIWLQLIFIGFKKYKNNEQQAIKKLLNEKYQSLGPIRYEEKSILILFVLMILLWFFRNPKFITGWSILFQDKYVSDGTVAMAIALLLFVIPAENPFIKINSNKIIRPLMTWEQMQYKFNWGTIILLGGGYAMAEGVEKSGLSTFISLKLSNIHNVPEWLFLSISCIMVTFLTEFSSNVATASIFIPMVRSIADNHNVNPLYYVIPITLSSSFAFMFPAAPPNAIVFGTRLLKISDMLIGGSMLNVVAFLISQVSINTYGRLLFDLNHVPNWAKNLTTIPTTISSNTIY